MTEYFVTSETVRLPILEGAHWIEVKAALTAGEDKRLTGAGLRTMRRTTDGDGTADVAFDLDLEYAALMKVAIYLVDWSLARDIKNPKLKLEALRNLRTVFFIVPNRNIVRFEEGFELRVSYYMKNLVPLSEIFIVGNLENVLLALTVKSILAHLV